MELFRNRNLVKVKQLIGCTGSDLDKVCINERASDSLCAGDEDFSQRDFTEKDRRFEKEGDRIYHEGEDDLDKETFTH
jgi:hypothetical protein